MIKTRKSNPNKPPRVMIHAGEGVGKSTLGAKSDSPVFITPEGGTDQLTDKDGNPIEEMENVDTWEGVVKAIDQLTEEDHNFKTLVIDSADWLEKLAHAKIIGTAKKDIIRANGGYGAGYRESENLHRELIAKLSDLREKRNMAIIVTAHTHVRQAKDPEILEDYDAFEVKCHEFVSALWREWVDILLFARFRTYLKQGENTKSRAITDGSRVVYTTKTPAYQAKNRYGMPSEMDFTENFWDAMKPFTAKGAKPVTAEEVLENISEKLSLLADEKLKATIEKFANENKSDLSKLVATKKRLDVLIKERTQ